ncbi:MAG: hypothetical protein Q7S94_04710, partial [Gallionella sp.]|nr:hypothetical protein [Gallionella sp.]
MFKLAMTTTVFFLIAQRGAKGLRGFIAQRPSWLPGYAARASGSGTSQPGNTSTAGWHWRARAKTFARSTPKFTLPFSMAEIVA